MESPIPSAVSYEMLLQAVCCRAVTGKTNDEIQYLVDLAEQLCRLMREIELQQRRAA
jgi:hypothetical protein